MTVQEEQDAGEAGERGIEQRTRRARLTEIS